MCEYRSFDELVNDWRQEAELAIVDRFSAEPLGLCAEEGIFQKVDDSGRFEVCRYDCILESIKIRIAEKLGKRSIESGADANKVWKERLAKLAFYSKRVVICDRYCGKGLIRGEDRNFVSSIEWLLRRLDRCGKTFVHVITQYEDDFQLKCIDEGFRRVSGVLNSGGIKDLKVSYIPERWLAEIAHGRHMRFDETAVWLDPGIDLFGDRPVKQLYGFSVFSHKEARNREDKLVSKAQKPEVYK